MINSASINFYKFIFSMLVALIHLYPFQSFLPLIQEGISGSIARLAVPFFFVTTGFFLADRLLNRYSIAIQKSIKKYLKIYLGSIIVYSILIFFTSTENFFETSLRIFEIFILKGSYAHLWYLYALILAIIAIYLFLKYFKFSTLIFVAAILFSFGLLTDSYYGFLPTSQFINSIITMFDFPRNFLVFAIPMITLGMVIQKFNMQGRIKKINLWMIVTILIFMAEVALSVYLDVAREHNMYMSFIIVVPILFVWVSTRKENNFIEKNSKIFATMSLDIYIYHVIFGFIVRKIFINTMNIDLLQEASYLYYILSVLLSVSVPYLMRKHVKFSWIKNQSFRLVKTR